jgi:hypothetical protein
MQGFQGKDSSVVVYNWQCLCVYLRNKGTGPKILFFEIQEHKFSQRQ